MSPIKIGKESGPKGSARISINSKGRIIVVFEDTGDRRELFAEDNETYFPIIERLRDAKALGKPLFVRLNKEGTQIYGMTPPGGKGYIGIFKQFAAKKNEAPIPSWVDPKSGMKNGKHWEIPGHMEFRAIFEIVSGPYIGLEIAPNFSYVFKEDADGQTQLMGSGVQKTTEFLQKCGMNFATDSIPYSDNVLPFVEEILIQRQVPVVLNLKDDGFVESITSAPDGMELNLPKKKAAKK